jgi:sugar O-acyltransferase (sialic acid O-acetyltransferase NeuD family)
VRFVLFAVATPFASELLETARRAGLECVPVTNMPELPVPAEITDVLDAGALDAPLLELPFAVPQTVPANRQRAIAAARARGFRRALTLLDPTAVIASTAAIGECSYVGSGAVIASGVRAGFATLVNRSCSIGHHTTLGDYVCTGPGVVVAGSCRLGAGVFLGAGAVLAPELQIGAGAIVGAGAVVIADVAPGDVVVGNPAHVLRRADPSTGIVSPA